MATPVLKAEIRDLKGKGNIKQARNEGKTPGVIYSRGQDTKQIFIDTKEVQRMLSRFGQSMRIGLELEGEKTFVIIKEIQKGNILNELIHLDFQTLDENEKIRMIMPIQLINREQVETADQFLQFMISEVEIQSYPKHLPDRIEIDASKLRDQDALTIADLSIANDENIEILEDMDNVVASLVYAQEEVVEEDGEDEEETEVEETEE